MELIYLIVPQLLLLVIGAVVSFYVTAPLEHKRIQNNILKANNELQSFIQRNVDFNSYEDERIALSKKYRIDLNLIDTPRHAVRKLMDDDIPVLKLEKIDATKSSEIYSEAAALAARMHEDNKAVVYYENAIKTFPWVNKDKNKIGKLYILRGGILKRLQHYHQAEDSLKQGLELVDDDVMICDAYYNLACIYGILDKEVEFRNLIRNIP